MKATLEALWAQRGAELDIEEYSSCHAISTPRDPCIGILGRCGSRVFKPPCDRKNMQDAARRCEDRRSVRELYDRWRLTNLNYNVARDENQVVEPALAHQFQMVLQSEEIARASLQAYLDAGSPIHNAANGTFEDRGSVWPQHYRVAEAYSDKLPAILHNCLQIWAQPREDERNRGRSDVFHRSPLHLCSAFGFEGLGEVYLQMGKDPNILAYPDGQTALHLASAGGHIGIIGKLLDRDADIEKTTLLTGRTALQMAASRGHKDAVQLLLGEGADVNAMDKLGNTALKLAAQNGHEEVVELLINHVSCIWWVLGWHEATACDCPRPITLYCCRCRDGPKHERNRTQCASCKHIQHLLQDPAATTARMQNNGVGTAANLAMDIAATPAANPNLNAVDEGWISVDHLQNM